ncbi:MAG: Maltose acetyltransferase [Claussenomyces sp. TS43310]|nr:MAG: Maltose acetyltransferase [Claussenomyces sp. TS43310]
MTAVERQSTPSAFLGEQQAESPTSRFTAVNGRDSGSAAPTNVNGHTYSRRASEDRLQGQPRASPPGQEKLTISTAREDWAQPVNGQTTSHTSANQLSQSSKDSEAASSHKRKRSGSQEAPPSSDSTYHSHGLPPSKPGLESGQNQESPSTPQEISQYHYNDSTRDHARSWFSQQGRDQPQSSQSANTEDQLREALVRENQAAETPIEYVRTSPGDDDDHNMSYQSGYGENRTAAQLQQDERKKRKRNFSNRTKTGCMTCRKRKKKCDETRPECNNCIRGGFVCNGYPSRGQWPKTEQKQAPIPLQSKDGYESGPNPYTAVPQYQQQPHQPIQQGKREPLPAYRGQQPPRVDTQQPPRLLSLDDDRQNASNLLSASTNSPENRLSAASYSQTSPFPTPISAHPNAYDRLPQDNFKRMPLLESSRQEHDPSLSQSPQNAIPHISILNPPHIDSPHPLAQSTSVQDAARLALSHPASNPRQRTQKEQMLLGSHYYPFDRELVLERERCNAACWRFNSSTNPNNGVSPEERARLFRDILQPNIHINISPTEKSPVSPAGQVGNNVVVEAPFTCDYGYNIHIGQDVAIGKNCTILDTCEVAIGDRTVLGPNVNIYTATLPVDPKRRLGSRGPHLGHRIVIEEDCWIGGGVTILPGRTIRKGSTVGAGSIVTRDVPPYTVVCGNPARVIRGLYRDPAHE